MMALKLIPPRRRIGVAIAMLVAIAGCTHLTKQDQSEIATYAGEQSACVAATPSDKAAIDSCRAAVKAKWCAQWADRFEAGVCP